MVRHAVSRRRHYAARLHSLAERIRGHAPELHQPTWAEIVHACPPEGSGIMPCCGRTPFDAPLTDRMTLDPALVTCGRDRDPREVAAFLAAFRAEEKR